MAPAAELGDHRVTPADGHVVDSGAATKGALLGGGDEYVALVGGFEEGDLEAGGHGAYTAVQTNPASTNSRSHWPRVRCETRESLNNHVPAASAAMGGPVSAQRLGQLKATPYHEVWPEDVQAIAKELEKQGLSRAVK